MDSVGLDIGSLVAGGAVLTAISTAIVSLRMLPAALFRAWVRRYTTEIEISNNDEAFYWLSKWLDQNEYARKSRILSASTRGSSDHYPSHFVTGHAQELELPELIFSPAVGMHVIRYKGQRILLTRTREEAKEAFSGPQVERYRLRMLGDAQGTLRELLAEAKELAKPKSDGTVIIKTRSWNGWSQSQRLPPRKIDSVVLDGMEHEVLEDARWFFEAEEEYSEKGVPYRRGYLLKGVSRSGKTSLAHALASEMGCSIYALSLNGCSEESFVNMVADVPPRSILLIEDIDCVMSGRVMNVESTGNAPSVSFATVLNAIDGVVAGTGRLVIMTSNHPEDLDEALVGPGRCDRQWEFKHATRSQAEALFERHFGSDHLDEKERFGEALPEGIRMAAIQGVLMMNRGDPRGAVSALSGLEPGKESA